MMAGCTGQDPIRWRNPSMAQRLSFDERARVEAMSAAGVSVATAARCLGRHRSTVHRELRRGRRGGAYDAEAAQAAAAVGAARPKTPVLAADPELAASVRELLKEGWSPHAICAGLRAGGRTVSAETIYRAAYDHSGSSGLPEGSWRCLPRRRRRRKPRGRCTTKPSPLGDFRPICERPASVEDRSEAGHWEGDLIIGAGNRSAVATLVERSSRQTLAVALPDGYDAPRTADAVAGALSRQPRHMVKTLTWDQGRETARWQHVETPPASRCTSVSRARRGSAPPTSRPTVSIGGVRWRGRQTGPGGGVVTHRPTDRSRVLRPICPHAAAGAGPVFRWRPDQKPVRPCGVTHHSSVVAVPLRRMSSHSNIGEQPCQQMHQHM